MIEPLVVSWGYEAENPSDSQYLDYMQWQGTNDMSAYLTIPETIKFLNEHDWKERAKECRELNLWAKNEICEKLNTYSLGNDEFLAQMTTIAFDFEDTINKKMEFYNKYKIQVPFIKWNNKTFFRISSQVYNSKDDFEYLINSLKILKMRKNHIIINISFFFHVLFKQMIEGIVYKVGDKAPKIDLELLDGRKLTNENLKGKKSLVIQFTASWCGVCIKEMPHLEKEVWQRFKNDDFLLVGVDLKEELSVVEEFIQSTNVTYPFTIDKDGTFFDSFTIPGAGVTRNIVIDKDGKISFLTRLFDENEFQQMIKKINFFLMII